MPQTRMQDGAQATLFLSLARAPNRAGQNTQR
jgi:hypothetical protein